MAVRFNAAGEYLERTANLPSINGATVCGWAIRDGDQNTHTEVCGLWNGTSDNSIMFDADGTTLAVWADGPGTASFSTSPSAGEPFFWALVCQRTVEVRGYLRIANATTLQTASESNGHPWSAPDTFVIGNGPSADRNYPLDGRVWNVKCWDRILTASELLVESYYRRVMFPSSINFHLPLDRHDDLNDYSGNGRSATAGGTLSTEDGSLGLWRPRRRIFIPAASGAQTLSPSGVATAEAFGTATIAKGGVSITPSGIASAEAFGTTVLTSVRILSPSSIASAESFGTAVLARGVVNIAPSGVASAESFGSHAVQGSTTIVTPTGITSLEQFGSAVLQVGGVTIVPNAIVSAEAFGTTVLTGATLIAPNGIASLEAHGTATLVRGGVVITPSGIVSLEQFGSVVIAGAVTATEARRYLGLLARLHRR
jgi:hypothetical protein